MRELQAQKFDIGEQVGHLNTRICNFYVLHDRMRNTMLVPRQERWYRAHSSIYDRYWSS